MALTDKLTAIGDAIRAKTGETELMTLDEMAGNINGITSNGVIWNEMNERGFPTKATLTHLINNTIPEYCFYGAARVSSSYGYNGYGIYSKLEEVLIPDGYSSIGSYAFYGCNISSINLSNNLTMIGEQAFYACTELSLSSIPDSIVTIKDRVFVFCYNLALSDLPSSLQNIGNQAFSSCINITISNIPATVQDIGSYAFEGCSKITSITFDGIPQTLQPTSFANKNITTINVPWAEGEVANAPWGATNATINYNYTGE